MYWDFWIRAARAHARTHARTHTHTHTHTQYPVCATHCETFSYNTGISPSSMQYQLEKCIESTVHTGTTRSE